VIDLRWPRENPGAFDHALARRGQPPAAAGVLELDALRRELETRLQDDQATRNRLSREIGQRSGQGERPSPERLAEMGALKERVKLGEDELRDLQARLDTLLATFPNPLAEDVPDGPDETSNVELRRWGSPRDFAFDPLPHDEVGAGLGMDFGRAARLSGARFVALWGHLATLERALGQFMLSLQIQEHGYTEVAVPYLVRADALFGTGQLPKMAADLFRTTTDHYLIPTAEVPLTNLVAGEILDDAALPLRLTALTPSFRSEAGAAGKDTKGMIRQHQFMKVELVSITTPDDSDAEHERMVGCAEAVLRRLDLPYRVMALASGDTGFAARRTYDLEVWLPGQRAYREISSCSTCGDFQARRMNARSRPKDAKQTRFVHTLNGSGLAVGRTLIAVLENYQEADGSVVIPEALRPFLHGRERLSPGAS
jgi:seryl-tRNA synthetase